MTNQRGRRLLAFLAPGVAGGFGQGTTEINRVLIHADPLSMKIAYNRQ